MRPSSMSRLAVVLVAFVHVLPGVASAGEVVFQFRSQESAKAEDPEGCKVAPFEVNVRLPAEVLVAEKHGADGKVLLAGEKKVGTGLACARITDRTFTEGSLVDFYARFTLPEGRFTAVGKCMVSSNTVPRAGVVLASCVLKLTEFPAKYAGGIMTSASIFNPQNLPGYHTGSFWTLRAFEADPAPPAPKK
ncbi:hypothetical protein [Hyalangium rubrum]|uniref:Lipoprotein n=1 Tax=Hyalangium rubrum TaxID=3103134 RepID=A0ABU5GXP9_9BACT|nr:hypothetical protein [Hyalangium sp. s54d21]MDY7225960.1 hypothetical protein [Hyalangium sp. s54d21]